MSLVTRVSAFFLTMLGVVLVGLSVALYVLAHGYVYGQFDDRLDTALNILEAAVDVETDGLEWEPEDRRILIGTDPAPDNVRWAVLNDRRQVIDHSANCTGTFPETWQPSRWPADPPDGTAFGDTGSWRLGCRRLMLEDLLRLGRGHPEDDTPDNDVEYPTLYLVAGASPAAAHASLNKLALALIGLSAGVWGLCAALGRQFSRRALAPVTQMAAAARSMNIAEGGERLPVAATHDELEALGQAFNQLLDRLHETLERQQRFAGDASHQLRTPLTGLLSLVDVVRRRERAPDEYVDALDKVYDEALRMRQIVESLLFLARNSSQDMQINSEPIDLVTWLPRQLSQWSEHTRAADLHFLPPQVPHAVIRAQPALLLQLLEVLVDNALKYSVRGTAISVEVVRSGGRAGFAVTDRGCGISASDLPQVFEPFFRATDAHPQGRPGVGLGLSIARRIAEAIGGEIRARSIAGAGSTFEVEFPALPESAIPALERTVEPAANA